MMKTKLREQFARYFSIEDTLHFFSAPGRVELGGNHTDHQQGRVLAAAVELFSFGAAAKNKSNTVRLKSEGYPMVEVDLCDLSAKASEKNTTTALVRGILKAFEENGASLSGFDAYVCSDVLPGSGLSSSASFEILLGNMVNHLFFDDGLNPIELAQVGQWAENNYFGKPCGLMDQTACSVGGAVTVDFYEPQLPLLRKIDVDFEKYGYSLCIVNCGAAHDDLTEEYAAIPAEMKAVANCFKKDTLSRVKVEEFYENLPRLRQQVGDRAVLRAMHFFDEQKRVELQAAALEEGNIDEFLRLVGASGKSSALLLQNSNPCGSKESQPMGLALALCERFLEGEGAFRVHGGGFGGTAQAFVPLERKQEFTEKMEGVFGKGACIWLKISPFGGRVWEETE